MPDLLYWTARLGLVVAWLIVATGSFGRRAEWRRPWSACAAAALVFASMRAWPWNYWLLQTARAGLQTAGVYDDRIWFKLLLGALLLVVTVAAACHLRRLTERPALLTCCAGIGLQGILLAVETLSLDDALPRWSLQQPGRYLLEGAFAAVALTGLSRSPRSEGP